MKICTKGETPGCPESRLDNPSGGKCQGAPIKKVCTKGEAPVATKEAGRMTPTVVNAEAPPWREDEKMAVEAGVPPRRADKKRETPVAA
jgi:hypothetical protein